MYFSIMVFVASMFVHRVFFMASCIVPSPEPPVRPSSFPCYFPPCFVLLPCFVWSIIIHFLFPLFFFFSVPHPPLLPSLPPSFFLLFLLFFSIVASLTASVHAPSGPVPTETQFPWKQIHQELQVTNHVPAKCHSWNDRGFFYIYIDDQTQ